jgi:hypothetical protein
MTKGWRIGLGVLAGVLVIGAIVGPRATRNSSSTGAGPSGQVSAAAPERSSGVTMAKYQQLRTGMTYDEAVAVLGGPGEEMSSNEIAGIRTAMYMWRGESMGANMNAMFQNGRLIQKAQFGLK